MEGIKKLLFSTLEQSQKYFSENVFQNYNEYKLITGFKITSAADAIVINNYHEAFHAGILMQIKKFI